MSVLGIGNSFLIYYSTLSNQQHIKGFKNYAGQVDYTKQTASNAVFELGAMAGDMGGYAMATMAIDHFTGGHGKDLASKGLKKATDKLRGVSDETRNNTNNSPKSHPDSKTNQQSHDNSFTNLDNLEEERKNATSKLSNNYTKIKAEIDTNL